MKTLVISDLHLGTRRRHDVLRRRPALDALLAALADVDRLVLLGDTIELATRRARQSMPEAEPVLRAIGERLGADREVIVVPGNHDLLLARPWIRAHARALTADSTIPPDATPLLAQVTGWLAPASVRVHYPGVWLGDRVWATHGHYLDRHLLPESAYGMARGALGRLPRDGAAPADYEQSHRPSVTWVEATVSRLLPGRLADAAGGLGGSLRARTMPAVERGIVRRSFAPLTSRMLSFQMQRAAIPALARVVHRLGVDADWVVFGHVHRGGPLEGDDAAQWTGADNRLRILNTGSWVYEPRLLHRATPPYPYWPGGAVVLEPGRDPRAIALLDHLRADALG